jgi:DNA-directed RNA polymerase specialized sigma24 family protein
VRRRNFILVVQCRFLHAEGVRGVATLEGKDALTHFATTRWSLIRNGGAAGARGDGNDGLAQLCHIYWRPIFTFIYRRGYSAQDAQDLTQDFFLVILEGTLLQSADPARGSFRSLLVKSLKNFLIDARVRRRARKRGGDLQFVSWEKWMADAPCQLSISAHALATSPAEALFDLSWAAAIAEEALRRLRTECESKGRRRVYEVLNRYLTTERGDISYRDLSIALGAPEPSVKSLLHQFRKRYRGLLREEVAKTVESEAGVDDEIRYLCALLSTRSG